MATDTRNPRILMFSQRNIFKALFRCALYEFEDVISQIDSVDLLAPRADLATLRHRLSQHIAYHAPIALNPGIQRMSINNRYDMFLAVCGAPQDLLVVNAVRALRDACTISVCLLDEIWAREIAGFRYFLRILKDFDVVMLYYNGSVKPLSDRVGCKCVFLPPGVDTIRFCPYPGPPKRVVDIYSIGRRSEITHRTLLKMAAENGLFYLHDSIAGDKVISLTDHRKLLANVAKRSRYFVVNPGLIDRPEKRGNQIEIGNRYFEGAASGAIMVGERPDNVIFERLFDWPDAVVDVPYNSDKIDQVLHELDRDPEKQERMRRTNITQALMRHDWVYRWETILNTVGIEPMPELLQRKDRLRSIADIIKRGDPDKLHSGIPKDGTGCLQQ